MSTSLTAASLGRSLRGPVGVGVGIGLVLSVVAGDPFVAASTLVLGGIWWVLPGAARHPVLAMALTFQWAQIAAGPVYHALTGRALLDFAAPGWRPTAWLALAALVVMAIGLLVGLRVGRSECRTGTECRLDRTTAFWAWGLTFVATIATERLAWQFRGLTQPVLALSLIRLVLFHVLFSRLVGDSSVALAFVVLLLEVGRGVGGFLAGFREPLFIAGVALLHVTGLRRPRHLAAISALACLALVMGVTWTGVKDEFRSRFGGDEVSRLGRLATLVGRWVDLGPARWSIDSDRLVSRLWEIHYPSLAVRRVPDVVPHTGGTILACAALHVAMPRLLFPEKPLTRSESENVERFCGVHVASGSGTNIAFGQIPECYVDFGVPWMFLPLFLWGGALGLLFAASRHLVHHSDLADGFLTVAFWSGLYAFEGSWIKVMGFFLTIVAFLGPLVIALDRRLIRHSERLHRAP